MHRSHCGIPAHGWILETINLDVADTARQPLHALESTMCAPHSGLVLRRRTQDLGRRILGQRYCAESDAQVLVVTHVAQVRREHVCESFSVAQIVVIVFAFVRTKIAASIFLALSGATYSAFKIDNVLSMTRARTCASSAGPVLPALIHGTQEPTCYACRPPPSTSSAARPPKRVAFCFPEPASPRKRRPLYMLKSLNPPACACRLHCA